MARSTNRLTEHACSLFRELKVWFPLKNVSFPFPSSSLASWDTHKHTSKEQSTGNEIFLADILGTDSYCSTSFGLPGWHVANTMYTLTKNVCFLGSVCVCVCVCVNSKEDRTLLMML